MNVYTIRTVEAETRPRTRESFAPVVPKISMVTGDGILELSFSVLGSSFRECRFLIERIGSAIS